MWPVKLIIDKLQGALPWADGEGLDSIRAKLSPGQLEAPGSLALRISERGELPGLLCARVIQNGSQLFEVKHRLPASATSENIDALITTWQAAGYIERITISTPNRREE